MDLVQNLLGTPQLGQNSHDNWRESVPNNAQLRFLFQISFVVPKMAQIQIRQRYVVVDCWATLKFSFSGKLATDARTLVALA